MSSLSMSSVNQWIKSIVILAVITFITHYLHYQSLGLYEDDYFLIAHPMSMNLEEFGEFMKWHTINFSATEGRPLLHIIEFSVGFVGNLIQDFKPLYLIDYTVILINNILIYIFLQSLWNQPVFAIGGTLAFTLFPAETTHAYLTHINLYLSLTFLLLAFFSYFYNKKLLSYLLIFSTIFCYETVFPPFILAPLFKKKWDQKLFKEMLRHALIMAGMLAVILIARKITGEARISELDIPTLIGTPLSQMVIGPLVSLSMFFYRPAQTLLNLKGELLIFVPLFFVGFILLFSRLQIEPESNLSGDNNTIIFSPIKQLTILGLMLLVLSYPLNFTRAATEISGRSSRVHMVAAIGAAILVGLFCYFIVKLTKNNVAKNIVNTGLAFLFSLLVGFGLIVQQENQNSWEYQRSFWTDVIHLAPDIEPETIILVNAPDLNMGNYLYSFYEWGVPMTLREIYKFPESWARLDELPKTDDKPRWYFWRKYTMYPKLYRLSDHWQDTIVKQGQFNFDPKNQAFDYFLQWEPTRLIDSHDIILLEEKNGKLVRRTEPLTIGNQVFEFQPISQSTVQSFEKGVLYQHLIKSEDEKQVSYINEYLKS